MSDEAEAEVEAAKAVPLDREGAAPLAAKADAHSVRLPAESFDDVFRRVEDASRAWDIHPELPEGRLVAALMGAIGWSGRLTQSGHAEFRAMFKRDRDEAKLELQRAQEITKAANAALGQARNAVIGLGIERENIVGRIIKEAMPDVAAKLRDGMVSREVGWDGKARVRGLAAAGAIALGVFGCGYGLRAWGDADAVAARGAMSRCLQRPLWAEGHMYCDVTAFHEPARE